MSPSRPHLVGLLVLAVVVAVPICTGIGGGAVGEGLVHGAGLQTGVPGDVAGGTQGTVAAAQETSGSLSQSTYEITRGNEVEITFSHSGPATLYVGDEDAGYRLGVNVSGSGTSTVTIDTYASTSRDPEDYVEGGEPQLLYPTDGLDQALVATSYNLNLTVGGVTEDLGMLVIDERPPVELSTHVAPGEIDPDETDLVEVLAGSTPGDRVAKGDIAVLELNATGLSNAIDPDDLGGGQDARGIELYVADGQPPPNSPSDSFGVRTSRPDIDTLWDEEAETLLVLWDTSSVELLDGVHRYDITLTIEADHNELVTEDVQEANTSVTVVRPRIDLETADALEMNPWDGDVLSLEGSTNYAPGTTFEFRARSFEPRPFLKKSPATVAQNGSFSAEIDFGDEARGIAVDLWILGHRDLAEWDLNRRDAAAGFTFENQTAEEGDLARAKNVSLSVGGHLVVRNRNGTVLGVSEPIGEQPVETVTVTLDPALERSAYLTATAVMDWNQNGTYEPGVDRPYAENGSNVTRRAVVFVPETGDPEPPGEGNPTTTTVTTTGTETASSNTTPNATATVTTLSVETSDPLTPGTTAGNASLSPVFTVVALLGAALLVSRRAA